MTTYAERPTVSVPRPTEPSRKGRMIIKWMTTTDHKVIGHLYLITSFIWFLVGGIMALFMRAELARPGLQFLSVEQYNQLFTMHGIIMLLMFATPLFVGFANEIKKDVPEGLKVECPDQTHINISGCDKQLVGQFAAAIRSLRKPEPYKGKGIRYVGEQIKLKPGKAASK